MLDAACIPCTRMSNDRRASASSPSQRAWSENETGGNCRAQMIAHFTCQDKLLASTRSLDLERG